MRRLTARLLAMFTLLGVAFAPAALAAQANAFGAGSRAHLFVYLSYAAAWIVIGLWVLRIGRMLRRLVVLENQRP